MAQYSVTGNGNGEKFNIYAVAYSLTIKPMTKMKKEITNYKDTMFEVNRSYDVTYDGGFTKRFSVCINVSNDSEIKENQANAELTLLMLNADGEESNKCTISYTDDELADIIKMLQIAQSKIQALCDIVASEQAAN